MADASRGARRPRGGPTGARPRRRHGRVETLEKYPTGTSADGHHEPPVVEAGDSGDDAVPVLGSPAAIADVPLTRTGGDDGQEIGGESSAHAPTVSAPLSAEKTLDSMAPTVDHARLGCSLRPPASCSPPTLLADPPFAVAQPLHRRPAHAFSVPRPSASSRCGESPQSRPPGFVGQPTAHHDRASDLSPRRRRP